MFAEWLPVEDALTEPALITRCEQQTWADLLQQIELRAANLAPCSGQRVGLLLAPGIESINQLLALVTVGAHIYLIAGETPDKVVRDWTLQFGLSTILRPDGLQSQLDTESPHAVSGAITILTSGTTGEPKAVEHTWESLVRPVRRTADGRGDRWLLTYNPHLYAGLQVMLQCLLNQGTLVLPSSSDSAEEIVRLATEFEVQYASATPSYWRWLLTLAGDRHLSSIPLKQITLGGEAVDQATLNALKRVFPSTRLVHIYATTELGRCFSVTDGMAGFPARFLDKPSSDGVEMRIEDGELVVRSANSMSGYDRSDVPSPREEWFHTGDLVNIAEDRVLFVGRKTDMINVGGNKVYPVEVENVIRSVPGVADTRIYGEASSIVGELVKCELVILRSFEASEVEKAVRDKALTELNSFQRPRFISIVDEIPRTTAGKTNRSDHR